MTHQRVVPLELCLLLWASTLLRFGDGLFVQSRPCVESPKDHIIRFRSSQLRLMDARFRVQGSACGLHDWPSVLVAVLVYLEWTAAV